MELLFLDFLFFNDAIVEGGGFELWPNGSGEPHQPTSPYLP